jgi:hypothetical protein
MLMRIKKLVVLVILSGAFAGRLGAQSSWINGPVLGFVAERSGSFVRPILGIPGASILGEPLELGSEVRIVAISPRQDYAIAVRTEDKQFVLIPFRSATTEMIPVFGTSAEDSLVAISPTDPLSPNSIPNPDGFG